MANYFSDISKIKKQKEVEVQPKLTQNDHDIIEEIWSSGSNSSLVVPESTSPKKLSRFNAVAKEYKKAYQIMDEEKIISSCRRDRYMTENAGRLKEAGII